MNYSGSLSPVQRYHRGLKPIGALSATDQLMCNDVQSYCAISPIRCSVDLYQ
jgi:hypothetical protein